MGKIQHLDLLLQDLTKSIALFDDSFEYCSLKLVITIVRGCELKDIYTVHRENCYNF